MKAMVNTGPGEIEMRELAVPEPGSGQVRIRTAFTGICATDLEMIGGWDRTGFPAIPGHEWAGHVDAVGPGCDAALTGKPCVAENVLSDKGEVGFEHPGAYAECFLTEADNLHILPGTFPLRLGVLVEPLAVCVRGYNRLAPAPDEAVLIMGDGPIGLLMAFLLKSRGDAEITVLGGRAARLDTALQLGADSVLNYHDAVSLPNALEHSKFGTIIEASGSAAAIQAALRTAPAGARILVLGDYGAARADFGWNTVLLRELEIIGSNASGGGWEDAVALAAERGRLLECLITGEHPCSDFSKAVEAARSSRDQTKVVVAWP